MNTPVQKTPQQIVISKMTVTPNQSFVVSTTVDTSAIPVNSTVVNLGIQVTTSSAAVIVHSDSQNLIRTANESLSGISTVPSVSTSAKVGTRRSEQAH